MSQPDKPNETPKLIALIGGLVVVIGFIVWQVVNVTGPAPKPVATKETETSSAVQVAAEKPAPSPDEQEIEVPTLFASMSADPFRTVIKTEETAPTGSRLTGVAGARTLAGSTSKAGAPPVFPVLPGTFGAESVGVRVQGVIVGGDSVAVIRYGEKAFVLHKGGVFGDGMKVLGITESHVTVRKGKETIVLPVGEPH
jgi:hypothetical protein